MSICMPMSAFIIQLMDVLNIIYLISTYVHGLVFKTIYFLGLYNTSFRIFHTPTSIIAIQVKSNSNVILWFVHALYISKPILYFQRVADVHL